MKTPRAAIYARRSTDEHQVESLDTQLDNARRFAIAKGIHLDPAHEYTDTASRAEFAPKRRPGFAALRDAAGEGKFDVRSRATIRVWGATCCASRHSLKR